MAGPSGEPVTADTPFRIGSTSKQLTGLLIQQLIAEGALTHATTIGEALPWFGAGSSRLSTITVEQVLAHFSGLSTRAGLEQWGWRWDRPQSIEAAVRGIDIDSCWRLHDGLVHAIVGTEPAHTRSAAILRYAPALMIGLPALQLLALVCVRRTRGAVRRRVWTSGAFATGLVAIWLGYRYAPSRGPGAPFHQIWSAQPDLAVSTITSTVLAAVTLWIIGWGMAARLGPRLRRRIGDRGRRDS